MPQARPIMFFAGGGTGGHLYPGVAVANALRKNRPALRIVFLGTTRPLDERVLADAGYELIRQTIEPFRISRLWPFLKNLRASVRAARSMIETERPLAVLGLGGYAAAPAVWAARKAGCPSAILNPDLIAGKANRRLARVADAVFCQWDECRDHLPDSAVCKTTGCPIREEFLRADRRAGIARFGLDPARKTLLVTGASQGARTLNEAFVACLERLRPFAAAWQVLHLSGQDLEEETRRAYEQARPAIPYRLIGFTPQMADAMAAADLVVSRAGASTLAELTALAKPAVLLPYPYHKDEHQRRNGEVLATAGAARIVTDTTHRDKTSRRLGQVLFDLLSTPGALESMAATAARMGKPDAANRVAEELAKLAGLDRKDSVS